MSISNDIGTILMNAGKLTDEQYAVLKKKARDTNTSLAEVIRVSGTVETRDWYQAQSEVLGVPFIDLVGKTIKREVLTIIQDQLAKNYKMAAIEFDPETRLLTVGMVDLLDLNAREALRYIGREQNVKIQYVFVSPEGLDFVLRQYANITEEVGQALKSAEERFKPKDRAQNSETGESLEEVIKHAPVAKMVTVILRHAVEGKASDIHIEPLDDKTRVRYRIDGSLAQTITLPLYVHDALIARVKVMANLKIDETRIPQDGRITEEIGGRPIDFRVSTLPVISGEKIVMRILDKDQGLSSIETLGLFGTALENVKKALGETYGMILFTGPTGSGKSTSLYALLKILNIEERNIITLEDPIEYNIEGLNQSQIKPEIGYTFASGLRTILRQDPNVIMVGEIRDAETAELAVHAALTGHLMFSTLHTNTAVGAIPRLIDMGIEPFLLASSLRIVVAQRLVRKICDKCKEEKKVPESVRKAIEKGIADVCEDELKKYGVDRKEEIKFYHGKGCDACNGTGLRGRLAIYEAVPVNENIKNIIIEKRGNEEMIDKERIDLGVLTIKQDGILKIIKGLTTIEEIDRVTEGNMALEEEND